MNYQIKFHTVRNKLFIFFLSLCTFILNAQIPTPSTLVLDQAGLLSPEEKNQLERKLVDYDDSTSTQIAIALIQTLDGKDSFDYAMELAKSWGLAKKIRIMEWSFWWLWKIDKFELLQEEASRLN